MKLKLIICIVLLASLYNCSSKPSVTVLCEKGKDDTYMLKWELFPEVDNIPAEIYVSDNDSVFPPSPSLIVNSNDYIAIIKSDSLEKRKYFQINIGGTVSNVVSNRFFEMDSIQNFRDIGGYVTNEKQTVRWGKIYRSGSPLKMTKRDSLEFDCMGIKTIVDLRSQDVKGQFVNRYPSATNIRIPIAFNGYSSIAKKVFDGQFLRGDAIIYTQDTYRDMVNNFANKYAEFFDLLCNEDSYPIVYHCYLGKDQTGLATYFLLKALDVNLDMIEEDYMFSSIGIDKTKIASGADSLSEARQEALTMLTKTDLSYLKYGISCIREKSGSVDEYMLNELKLTPEKRRKLKSILLH